MDRLSAAFDDARRPVYKLVMQDKVLIELAAKHLDRVLGFFPRVEAKISSLFAVDAAMLGLLALNVSKGDQNIWYLVILNVATVVEIGASIWFLYRASYPELKGGARSFIYFKEIAAITETAYLKAMREMKDDDLVDDLLGQVWRNSEILAAKYHSVKYAFIATAIGVPIWFVTLVAASATHAALVVK